MIKTLETPKAKPAEKKHPTKVKARKGTLEALLQFRGSWHGTDEELDKLMTEVQELRDTGMLGAKETS